MKLAVTLAKLELKGRDSFTPKALLPPAEQALFGDGVVKAKPAKRDDDEEDDDEDIDDADVDEIMMDLDG